MRDLDELRGFRDRGKDPDNDRVSRMRETFLNEIEVEESRNSSQRQRRGRIADWVPEHRLAFSLSAAAAIAVVLTVGILLVAGRNAPEAVAGTLQRLARVAGRQPPAAAPGPGQFLYTKTQGIQSESSFDWTVLLPEMRESWISPDGSGRILTKRGPPSFPSERDRRAFRAEGSPGVKVGTTVDQKFPSGGLHYRDLSDLPADPARLGKLIDERKIEHGVPGDAESFVIIGELLHETYTRPAVRKALFEVAAKIPGVRSLGAVTDPVGRVGIGVALTAHGTRHSLIFDPRTSDLLASTDQVRDPRVRGGTAGTVAIYTAYLDTGVVDSGDNRP